MRGDPLASSSSRVANVPKLLSVILGKENLKSLRQLLLSVAESYPEAAELKSCLVQEFDHNEYTSLLDYTWCYVRPGSTPLQKGFSLKQYSSQSEVVHRTVQALLDSPFGRKNVLCYGYRKVSLVWCREMTDMIYADAIERESTWRCSMSNI